MKTFKQYLGEAWWIPPVVWGLEYFFPDPTDALFDNQSTSETADDVGGPWGGGSIPPPGWYPDPDADEGWNFRPNPGGTRHPDWYDWDIRQEKWIPNPRHPNYRPPPPPKPPDPLNPGFITPVHIRPESLRPSRPYLNPGMRAPLPGEFSPTQPTTPPVQPGQYPLENL